jgi:hypothetical protein
MAHTTPAELALELGVAQKRIRDVLRSRFGLLPDGVTRWELDDDQAQFVRETFADRDAQPVARWELEPGDTVRRRAIHDAYGGQQQGGISTPRGLSDVLIFTDPASGRRYGYDEFEGLREDGSYAYTGEGQYGDQIFVRGNRALLEAPAHGKIIRLLRTSGVNATYVGAFTIDDPPYVIKNIPDVLGNLRLGIIFNLLPISARVDLLPAFGGELPSTTPLPESLTEMSAWTPPNSSDVFIPMENALPVQDRYISRVEFALQEAFGGWLIEQGTPPLRLRLRVGSTMIQPDAYVPDQGWVVEAKRSTARGHVRTAIGQVLDYVHVARNSGLVANPVVLLPGRPEVDLIELMRSLGITLIFQSEDGFERIPAG